MKIALLRKFIVVAIWLILGVIWQSAGSAVEAAGISTIESLGRISEGLAVPTDLTIDSQGNLYVAEPRSQTIVKYDHYGRQASVFGPLPIAVASVAAYSEEGSAPVLYGAGGGSVIRVDGLTGDVLGYVGGANAFQNAYDLAVDDQGYLFVADSNLRRISVFDANGSLQFGFGAPGTGPTQFGTIAAIGVDPVADEIYVADNYAQGTTVLPQIKIFGLTGSYKRSLLAKNGFGSQALASFAGMAFDDQGRGYFLDSLKNQFRVLGLPSTYLKTFGTTGYETGRLVAPASAAYDKDNNRLFILCLDGRIEIFGIDGGTNPIKLNSPPGTPQPIDPIGSSEVASTQPLLSFQNSVDADDDIITYDIQVRQGEIIVAEIFEIAESSDSSQGATSSPLQENEEYSWRVQAFDGTNVSDWSNFERFYVNSEEEAPSAPILLSPSSGEAIEDGGMFTWQTASDPDPFDSLVYRLEVFEDPEMISLLAAEEIGGASLALGNLAAPASFQPGKTYFWRVISIDNHGLESRPSESASFVYGSSMLTVQANVPGAKVYLGGNHAYQGRYIGEAPVEIRGIAPGSYPVVVERAGFEPFIQNIRVEPGQNASLDAALQPLFLPAKYNLRNVEVPLGNIEMPAPFLLDFNGDGILDLILGGQAGQMALSPGLETKANRLRYDAGETLGLPMIPGATPFVVDWNNDDRMDILVGALDGSVRLFLGNSTQGQFSFDSGSFLLAGGQPVSVSAEAVPAVADVDGDGNKDLVVGSAEGKLILFLNEGSDQAPQLAAGIPWQSFDAATAPFFADVDGDGRRELLVAQHNRIDCFEVGSDKALVAQSEIHLSVEEGLKKGSGPEEDPSIYDKRRKAGKKNKKTVNIMPEIRRFFVTDFDGAGGKDVILSDAEGTLHRLEAHGKRLTEEFIEALRAKLSLIATEFEQTSIFCSEIETALDAEKYDEAQALSSVLATEVADSPDISVQVAELRALLVWFED